MEDVDDSAVGFVESKDKSELASSISKKGGNSYYYAHNYSGQNFNDETAKKVYGDGIIHGGDPILVSKSEDTKIKREDDGNQVKKRKISTFAWNDEDKKVKIYIDLAQFQTPITKEMVDIKIEEYKVDITIVDETGLNNILEIAPLYEKVEIEKSSWRINDKRITISLKKWLETKWYKLQKGGVAA